MIVINDIEQGTDKWLSLKAGVVSSSEFHRVITPKGKESQDSNFLIEKAIERKTGRLYSTFASYDMKRGIELQPEATALCELILDVEIHEIGFCFLDENRKIGASTDGLIEEDGAFEVKCPRGVTHWHYLDAGVLPSEYIPQVQGEMWVTDRKWCIFMSYYPGLDPLIIKVKRDDDYIQKLQRCVRRFVYQLDKLTEGE